MREIDNLKEFKQWIADKAKKPAAIQNLDITKHETQLLKLKFCSSVFFGCELSNEAAGYIVKTGGFVIPRNDDYCFEVHRSKLYSVE